MPALLTKRRLTLNDKFNIFAHQAFGPPALIFPQLVPAFAWRTRQKITLMSGSMAGERLEDFTEVRSRRRHPKGPLPFLQRLSCTKDPRYLPAPEGANMGGRIFHAVAFTFVDRSDSGGHMLAFSNFAAAAAGDSWAWPLPNGFNDPSHAGQRAASELLGIAIANVSREFAPQWVPIVRKLHIPKIVPAWWVPEHPQHP